MVKDPIIFAAIIVIGMKKSYNGLQFGFVATQIFN